MKQNVGICCGSAIESTNRKHENNFKRCLSKLGLDDVRAAIQRAKEIMKMNKDNGKSLIRHGGYEYYEDNPALTMHEAVEKILVECGLY